MVLAWEHFVEVTWLQRHGVAVSLSCSRRVYFGCSVQDLLVVACAIFTCGMWNLVPDEDGTQGPLHWEHES